MAGHAATAVPRGMVAVFADGIYVIGNRSDVETALSPGQRPRAILPIVGKLDVSAGAVLSVYREGPGFYTDASPVSIVLETTADHAALRASATLSSAAAASDLLLRATAMRAKIVSTQLAADEGDARALQRVFADLHLAADGARIHGEIAVKGGADEQGKFAFQLVSVALAMRLLAIPRRLTFPGSDPRGRQHPDALRHQPRLRATE